MDRDIWSTFADWMFPNEACSAMEVRVAPGGMAFAGALLVPAVRRARTDAANGDRYHA